MVTEDPLAFTVGGGPWEAVLGGMDQEKMTTKMKKKSLKKAKESKEDGYRPSNMANSAYL